MNQQQDNLKLFGQFQLNVYDKNNNLIQTVKNKNQVFGSGIETFCKIIANIQNANNPNSFQTTQTKQFNLFSNSVQFLSRKGQNAILQPIEFNNKQYIKFSDQSYTYMYSSSSAYFTEATNNTKTESANNNYYNGHGDKIKDKNALFRNLQINQSKRTIINVTKQRNWAYVYDLTSSLSAISNSSLHNGICLDISGYNSSSFYMQIAYDFDGTKQISTFNDIPKPIIPFMNGKPTNKQFNGFQGAALTDQQVYSYYFDMYPRCCVIPKRIIFLFQNCATNQKYSYKKDVKIGKFQFFRHRQPKYGPLSIYFDSSSETSVNSSTYCSVITKTKINENQNTISYYASIGYDEQNGSSFYYVGLNNFENNIVYQLDQQTNNQYNNDIQQKIDSTSPTTTGNYFYKSRIVNDASTARKLTCASLTSPIIKDQNKRIDIVYTLKLTFGSENSSSSSSIT